MYMYYIVNMYLRPCYVCVLRFLPSLVFEKEYDLCLLLVNLGRYKVVPGSEIDPFVFDRTWSPTKTTACLVDVRENEKRTAIMPIDCCTHTPIADLNRACRTACVDELGAVVGSKVFWAGTVSVAVNGCMRNRPLASPTSTCAFSP